MLLHYCARRARVLPSSPDLQKCICWEAQSGSAPSATACSDFAACILTTAALAQFHVSLQEQATGVEKEFWTKKTNPTFPSAPTPAPTPTTSSIPDHAEPSPRHNPFLDKGKSDSKTSPDAFPGQQHEQRQAGDQKKDPRKEFEAGLLGAVRTCKPTTDFPHSAVCAKGTKHVPLFGPCLCLIYSGTVCLFCLRRLQRR